MWKGGGLAVQPQQFAQILLVAGVAVLNGQAAKLPRPVVPGAQGFCVCFVLAAGYLVNLNGALLGGVGGGIGFYQGGNGRYPNPWQIPARAAQMLPPSVQPTTF